MIASLQEPPAVGSTPTPAPQAAPPEWRRRIRSPGALLRIGLLVLLVLPSLQPILRPLERGQRSLGLLFAGVPLALAVAVALSLWRHLSPGGLFGRRSETAFTLTAVVLGALSCAGPIPIFYWTVIDPIANARELRLVREGLAPLAESLRAETRRAGRPPQDVAPVLARQDAKTLRFLGLRDSSSVGYVRYFSGRERFALAARGTPAHLDSFAVVVYTPWDERWRWLDERYASGDHRAWLGEGGRGLQEWGCLSDPSGAGGWTCERYPREPTSR